MAEKETFTNDRLKRDEWSEGAVSSLLEAYEAKWALRNRAKLKGQDWEDVSKHVSARAGGSRSAKTQTQCKNKIESMKKRYRSESAGAGNDHGSTWPLYPRLDLLLRGNGSGPGPATQANNAPGSVVVVVDFPSVPPPPVPEAIPAPEDLVMGSHVVEEKSDGWNGGDRVAKEEGDGTNNIVKLTNGHDSKNPILDDTADSSTPTEKEKQNHTTKAALKSKCERKDKSILKRSRQECYRTEIGESIEWLAQVMVRSEQARMETMKEIEKMRVEADAKRGEMDLKRTEIIANTQLQIAKLFAKGPRS